MSSPGLVDLVVGLIVVLAVVGAVRRGSGLLSGLAAGVGAVIVCWLVAGALLAWAGPGVDRAIDRSELLQVVPPPAAAISSATDLVLPGADGPRDR